VSRAKQWLYSRLAGDYDVKARQRRDPPWNFGIFWSIHATFLHLFFWPRKPESQAFLTPEVLGEHSTLGVSPTGGGGSRADTHPPGSELGDLSQKPNKIQAENRGHKGVNYRSFCALNGHATPQAIQEEMLRFESSSSLAMYSFTTCPFCIKAKNILPRGRPGLP